jgi:hypothetical protein
MARLPIRSVLILTVGFGVGVLAGWLAFDRPSVTTESRGVTPASTTATEAERPGRTTASPRTKGGFTKISETGGAHSGAGAVVPSPSVSKSDTNEGHTQSLQERVQVLERELAETKERLAQLGGSALAEPPNLAGRFKQAALLEAVRGAFQDVNPKAEVTSIDCTEYPCIAYGSGLSIDQLRALNSSASMRPYSGDDVSHLILNGTIGVIATPKDDPNNGSDDAEQRILFRFHQMALANKQRQ